MQDYRVNSSGSRRAVLTTVLLPSCCYSTAVRRRHKTAQDYCINTLTPRHRCCPMSFPTAVLLLS